MHFTDKHNRRMELFRQAGLYLVTSSTASGGRSTSQIVSWALEGGVRLIQLREKDLAGRAFFDLAREVRGLTARADALLIINDRLDIALAVGADGVHLGQDDLPVDRARQIATDLVIGASTHSVEEASRAQALGTSYINIGPLFPTRTKQWSDDFLGLQGLTTISSAVSIPFSVMGGIKQEHIPALRAAGAQTIAVVTAVTEAADPQQATAELLAAIRAEVATP